MAPPPTCTPHACCPSVLLSEGLNKMSSSSAVFRARVECVLQAVMAHTAAEMVRLFEEALRTTEALQSEQQRSSKLLNESIPSVSAESAHTTAAAETESIFSESAESAHTTTAAAAETESILSESAESAHTTAAAETASDRRAVGAEALPAVQQVLSGEEALSLFRPVKDEDSTVTESPGPSQGRDVNLTGPLSHTAVGGGRVKRSRRPPCPRTVGSQTVSQFSVAAVKTEEGAMDYDFEGYDDVEPEHRDHTAEESGEDDNTSYRPRKRRKRYTGKKGTKRPSQHQKVCPGIFVCACSYCGKEFNRLRSLTTHEKNHSRTRYSCTFCDKTFLYEKICVAHEHRQHSNKKYGCSDCGKMFEKHSERDHHECIVFTGGFAFSCTECNKGFNRQYILKKHQLAEHPEIFSNKQKVQVLVEVDEVKIEEEYEQDMYGQDIDLKNQHSEQHMGLKNEQDEQDIGLNIQVHEQDMGLNIQVHEQDMGLNIQVHEQDMGLTSQVYELDIMGHEGEQYMGFMNLPESRHFHLE